MIKVKKRKDILKPRKKEKEEKKKKRVYSGIV
jgi:hypothetical protein